MTPGEAPSCEKPAGWAARATSAAVPGTLSKRRLLRLMAAQERAAEEALAEQLFGTTGFRRWLNVAVAATGLILLSPVMLLIALLIKASSPGPVLFRQVRIGLDRRNGGRSADDSRRQQDLGGRPFVMYKFRTMYNDTSRRVQMWASPDDPRVTPIGRILRKCRLDELPQLWNVLKGDMNIVGPRPEQPEIFSDLRSQLERYHHRQRVLPGITGHAQVNLNYDTSIETVREKLLLDLQYIERTSAMEDLKIMLLTLPVIVTGRGAW